MRPSRAKASGFFVVICISALAGGYSAIAEDVPASEVPFDAAHPSDQISNTRDEAATPAEPAPPSEATTEAAVTGAVASSEPSSGEAAANVPKAGGLDKLMTVPEDDISASFVPTSNPLVRELIEAHPSEDLVICIAGCLAREGAQIVYSTPSVRAASVKTASAKSASAKSAAAATEFVPTSAEKSPAEKASSTPLVLSATGEPIVAVKTQTD